MCKTPSALCSVSCSKASLTRASSRSRVCRECRRYARADVDSDTYRAVYTVNLGNAIYMLHVFQKKSKRGIETPKPDMDTIRSRLKQAKELASEQR